MLHKPHGQCPPFHKIRLQELDPHQEQGSECCGAWVKSEVLFYFMICEASVDHSDQSWLHSGLTERLEGYRRSAELRNQALQRHLDWVRTMLTLGVGSLTALVALQNNFYPGSLLTLGLLWVSWLLLAGSIAAAAATLHGEASLLVDAAKQKAERAGNGDQSPICASLPMYSRYADKSLPWLLVLSILFLCAFAISHSLERFTKQAWPKVVNASSRTESRLDGDGLAADQRACQSTQITRPFPPRSEAEPATQIWDATSNPKR